MVERPDHAVKKVILLQEMKGKATSMPEAALHTYVMHSVSEKRAYGANSDTMCMRMSWLELI